MARYQGVDASFDVPNDWEDKSVVAFSAPPKANTIVPNAVLTRDKLRNAETLDAYCDRTIVDMVKNLAGFKLIDKGPRQVGGTPAVEIKFSWQGSGGKSIVQHMVIAPLGGTAVIGLNMTCDQADAKRLEPIADRIFASFKLGAPSA